MWAVTVKKKALAPGEEFVSAVDLNEECLCFGWIDSRPARIDERRTALLCTPRKPGSGWSKVNKDRLDRLLAAGLVTDAGLDAIERAKHDGSWNRLDAVDQLTIPHDLAAALAAHLPAQANFDAFPPSARRGILEWINAAKTEPTRAKRIDETAQLAQRNIRANQWPRKQG
ncbi:MAG: YdeI/OmpD-associated family protein [Acidimicrobiales bacterium]